VVLLTILLAIDNYTGQTTGRYTRSRRSRRCCPPAYVLTAGASVKRANKNNCFQALLDKALSKIKIVFHFVFLHFGAAFCQKEFWELFQALS